MSTSSVFEQARLLAGLTQSALARLSGTSRPTLSAYEHGRKSPTLATASRILSAAGYSLQLTAEVEFEEVVVGRGRTTQVPTSLPRLPLDLALANVELPLHLNWSDLGRKFDLSDRRHRARVYEIVLREGTSDDFLTYVDGALLIDIFEDLVLPREIRTAWQGVVSRERGLELVR